MELFWQPWRPQFGQRVRLRLSGECERVWPCCNAEDKVVGHPEVVGGATGTVTFCPAHINCASKYPDHPYLVRLDQTVMCPHGQAIVAAHFAALELDPLDDEEPTG